MKSLYEMKEAAKIVSLYGKHIDHIVRDHEGMVGFLGSTQINLLNSTYFSYSGSDH